MPKTSPLAARLKRQMQAENETIQNLTKEQLAALRKKLHAITQKELHTIENAMQSQSRRLAGRLIWSRIFWPFLIGLILSAGIFSGSWGMMHYLNSQIRDRQNEITTMERTIQTLKTQGGRIQFSTCDYRTCVRIDETAPPYQRGYRILEGY